MLGCGARALCLRSCHIPNYGLKILLCMRMAFPYTMHEPEIIKWTWAELFEMNVKVKQGLDFDVDRGC